MLYYVTPLLPGEHKSKEKPEGTWKCPPPPGPVSLGWKALACPTLSATARTLACTTGTATSTAQGPAHTVQLHWEEASVIPQDRSQ